jgi:hypothetical protein
LDYILNQIKSYHYANSRMQIKLFQETWFIRVKENPVDHVFYLEVYKG